MELITGVPLQTSLFWELTTEYRYRLPFDIGIYVGILNCLVLWKTRASERPPFFCLPPLI